MENKETNERLKSVNELIRKLTVISNQYINEDKFERYINNLILFIYFNYIINPF